LGSDYFFVKSWMAFVLHYQANGVWGPFAFLIRGEIMDCLKGKQCYFWEKCGHRDIAEWCALHRDFTDGKPDDTTVLEIPSRDSSGIEHQVA